MAQVSTTDGRLLIEEIPVTANCAISDKHTALFILDDTEQYLGQDGNFYQLVSDKSCIPLMPKNEVAKTIEKERELEAYLDGVFDLTEDMKIYEQFMNAKKNDKGDVIKWVVSVVFAAFVIIAAIYKFAG